MNGELAGIPRFEESKMVGKQPFVYVDLKDSAVPVTVQMEAYTPFIPLNADDSGIPTAIIKYKVTNPTDKAVDVSVVGTMANVVGFDGYDVFNNVKLVDEVQNEYREEDGVHGWYYTAKNLKETDMKYGSMSIVTTNKNHITKKNGFMDNGQTMHRTSGMIFLQTANWTRKKKLKLKGVTC